MKKPIGTIFRQKICKNPKCGEIFFVCVSCDRGQAYCGKKCGKNGLRQQWREASRRYQQSPEGRLAHRDRQREYRKRKKAACQLKSASKSVTHKGSQAKDSSDILKGSPHKRAQNKPKQRWLNCLHKYGLLICQFCENMGRFIDINYENRQLHPLFIMRNFSATVT